MFLLLFSWQLLYEDNQNPCTKLKKERERIMGPHEFKFKNES